MDIFGVSNIKTEISDIRVILNISGVHTGHKYRHRHPEMGRKLSEMSTVIEDTVIQLPSDTLLLVFGDHGMTSRGSHKTTDLASGFENNANPLLLV